MIVVDIFAHCGLVGNPRLTAKIIIFFAPLPTSTKAMLGSFRWFSGNQQGFYQKSGCPKLGDASVQVIATSGDQHGATMLSFWFPF